MKIVHEIRSVIKIQKLIKKIHTQNLAYIASLTVINKVVHRDDEQIFFPL